MAAELAISIDPPTACTIRHPISQIAPLSPVNGSTDSVTEAAANTANPRL